MWHSHVSFLLRSVLTMGISDYRTGPLTIQTSNQYFHLESQISPTSKIPFCGCFFSQAKDLGHRGEQILWLLLCASPVVIQGYTQIPLAMSLDFYYLSDGLLLGERRERMNLHFWVMPPFTSLSLQPYGFAWILRLTLDPQYKLFASTLHLPRISFWRLSLNPCPCLPHITSMREEDGQVLKCTFWHQRDPVLLQLCHLVAVWTWATHLPPPDLVCSSVKWGYDRNLGLLEDLMRK